MLNFRVWVQELQTPAEILEIVAPFEKQILGFFCGHQHLNRVFREQGMLCIITAGIICYPMMWRQVHVFPDRIEVKSIPVDLPEVLAESEAVNPDNNLYLSGRPRDRGIYYTTEK